jgi:ubiquinone biosynthesis protein
VLLQKTLLNIEGLGRDLDPDLDLWKTALPFLERWMQEQLGWRAFARGVREEAPRWANLLPQLPRLLHGRLTADHASPLEQQLARLADDQRCQRRLLLGVAALLAAMFAWQVYLQMA